MTYIELLQQNEWHQKCQEILDRDKFQCQDCGCLGFHSHGYTILRTLHDVDNLLRDWRFKDVLFSEYIDNISIRDLPQMEVVEIRKEFQNDSVICFSLFPSVQWFFDYGNTPMGFIDQFNSYESILSSKKIRYFQTRIRSLHDSNKYGWLLYFEFSQVMANQTFMTIQYNSGYRMDEAIYDSFLISVTTRNKLIALRFYPGTFNMKGLNIHHNYYIHGRKPWEYPNDALVTLCEICHKKRHEKGAIYLLDLNHNYFKDLCKCGKCSGSGYLPQYWYRDNGICYECGGEGIELDNEIL